MRIISIGSKFHLFFRYSTQFYDSTSNNKLLNQTHFREEFVKNPNSYFENKILETLDIGKVNFDYKVEL